MTKLCYTCNILKDKKDFGLDKNRHDGLHCRCKECRTQKEREYRLKNKDRLNEYHKNYYKNNLEKCRKLSLDAQRKRLYGIDYNEYIKMMDKQYYKCAICKTGSPGTRDWNVDHCHKTGKIRSLLCRDCNLGLGNFKDNIHLLKTAIKYLNKFENKA